MFRFRYNPHPEQPVIVKDLRRKLSQAKESNDWETVRALRACLHLATGEDIGVPA